MTDTSVRSPKAQPAYSLRELLGYFFRLGAVEARSRSDRLDAPLLYRETERLGDGSRLRTQALTPPQRPTCCRCDPRLSQNPHRNEPVAAAHRIASSFGARMIPVAASLVGKNRTA